MPTPDKILTNEQIGTRRCGRCGHAVDISEACAIGKTFVIFYYCPTCYEIVANED